MWLSTNWQNSNVIMSIPTSREGSSIGTPRRRSYLSVFCQIRRSRGKNNVMYVLQYNLGTIIISYVPINSTNNYSLGQCISLITTNGHPHLQV